MAIANRTIRSGMMLSTAAAALMAVPGVAHAQLVRAGDLVDAIDSGGNAGRLVVVDTDANTTDMTVLSSVVVANWNRFNVPRGTTINIAPDAALMQATLFNRVIGGNLSEIRGSINAPDVNLWLVNQNGILFGDGAAVNSASFFASTIDVADQDIFDFYEGTDLFGNGADTLNFAGSLGNSVRTTSPNVSFVTDGSLMFVSEQLNLNATFDAGTGDISFVTAADLDVTFTPGSPLSFVVNAGTTVARGQTISGSVTGESVDFAMFTAAGVTSAVLQVNALVNATQAVPTDNGIRLIAEGADTPINATINGVMTSGGVVDFDVDGNLRTNASITGSAIDLDVGGTARLSDLTATDGGIAIDAAAITAATLTATGGDIGLLAAGGIATGALDASGAIDVESTGGGTVNLASLTAGGAVTLDTAGRLTAGGITAGGALTIGTDDLLNTNDPSSIRLNGDVTAQSIAITANGAMNAQNLTATVGGIELFLETAPSVTAGNLLATDAIEIVTFANRNTFGSLVSTGGLVSVNGFADQFTVTGLTQGTAVDMFVAGGNGISLGDVLATTGGVGLTASGAALSVGDVTAAGSIVLNGGTSLTAGALSSSGTNPSGGQVRLTSMGNITASSINAVVNGASGGQIEVVSSGGGAISLGDLTADRFIDLDTTGRITTGSIAAVGALTVGGTLVPDRVTFTGDASAASITITTLGAFSGQDLAATTGNIDIGASVITAGQVTATTGDITLLSAGNVTTTGIDAGGAIVVDSSGAGVLALGDLNAGSGIALDTTGRITTGAITALGDLVVGASAEPASVTFTGDATAQNITVDTGGAFAAQGLVASGTLDVDAGGTITTGNIDADLVTLLGAGAITTGDVATAQSLSIAATGGNLTVGDVTVGNAGATLSLSASGGARDVITGDLRTNEGNLLVSASRDITTGLVATSLAGDAFFGTIGLHAGRSIATGTIQAGEDLLASAELDFVADSVDAGDDVVITATRNITTGAIISTGQGSDAAAPAFAGPAGMSTLVFGAESLAGGTIALTAGGAAATGNLSAANAVLINANTINTGAVSTVSDDVVLQAVGAITTAGIAAGGAIDVDSTGGGALDLGALQATQDITLDTSGSVLTGSIDSAGELVIGGVSVASMVTITGTVAANSITVDTTGAFDSADLIATFGAIDIDADTINAGTLTASGGGVTLLAVGDITTSAIGASDAIDVDSTGMGANEGDLVLGNLSAGLGVTLDTNGTIETGNILAGGDLLIGGTRIADSVDLMGDTFAQSIAIATSGALSGFSLEATNGGIVVDAGSISAGALTANGGAVDLLASGAITTSSITASTAITVESTGGGALDLGTLNAGMGIALDTTGTVQTAGIAAGGALVVGALREASAVTFTDAVAASSITVDTTGALMATDLTATSGVIDVEAASIAASALSATGGGVTLLTVGGVDVASITTTGAIDVDSTAGGALDVGALDAGMGITLDTTGAVNTGAIAAGGALVVGGTREASAVNFADGVMAQSITVDTTGAFGALDMTTTAGVIDVDAGSIAANVLTANGGGVTLLAVGGVQTAGITTTGAIDVDSTAGGALDLSALNAGMGIALDTTGTVRTGGIAAGGALVVGGMREASAVTFTGDASARSVTVDTTGAFAAQAVAATNGVIDIDAGTIAAGALSATGGGVTLLAVGGVQTAGITTTGAIDVDSTAGGALDLGALNAGMGIALDTTGTVRTGGIAAGGALVVGGMREASAVTFTGDASARSVTVDTTGAFAAQAVAATNGVIDIDAGTIAAGALSATGGGVTLLAVGGVQTAGITTTGAIDVDSTAGGALNLGALNAGMGIALDTTGAVTTGMITTGGALVVGGMREASAVTFTGNAAARSITIDTTGALTAQNLTSTGGVIDIDAGTIAAGALSATGGGVTLLAVGGVQTAGITTTGAIDVDSTGTGASAGLLNLGTLLADLGITLDTQGAIATGAMTARSGAVVANGQTITSGAISATGGDVLLNAAGAITTGAISATRAGGMGGAITIAGNAITAGAVSATEALTLNSAGDIVIASGRGRDVAITANELRVAGALASDTGMVVTAADVEFGGAVTTGATNTLTLNATRNVAIGPNEMMGQTAVFSLSDAELDRISTADLMINAGARDVVINGASFAADAGRNTVTIASTGNVAITGNLTGAGAGRAFRIGGAADGSGVADRITANIDTALIDIGTSSLTLQGDNIAFGQQALIDDVDGLSIVELVRQFVSAPQSLLYTPRGAITNPVYLTAGSLTVTYGGSALFQNTATRADGNPFQGVVLAGGAAAVPALTLNPLNPPQVVNGRAVPTNAFALFGSVGGFEGLAAALAGDAVISVNDEILLDASRINGCVIGSGADCVTTIVGNVVLTVPREVVSLLVAEDRLLVPFDPLVGTNNESLFSDAASATDEDRACESRDANGVCVSN